MNDWKYLCSSAVQYCFLFRDNLQCDFCISSWSPAGPNNNCLEGSNKDVSTNGSITKSRVSPSKSLHQSSQSTVASSLLGSPSVSPQSISAKTSAYLSLNCWIDFEGNLFASASILSHDFSYHNSAKCALNSSSSQDVHSWVAFGSITSKKPFPLL